MNRKLQPEIEKKRRKTICEKKIEKTILRKTVVMGTGADNNGWNGKQGSQYGLHIVR